MSAVQKLSRVRFGSRQKQRGLGGVTGRGFQPGQSGNPGGRPEGLSRRVRELVGDDGHEIADFIFSAMADEGARNADRIDAAKWLADRASGGRRSSSMRA